MAITRQRRARAHREQLRARQTQRRPDAVARQIDRMDRFDEGLVKVVAWSAIALAVLIVVTVAVT